MRSGESKSERNLFRRVRAVALAAGLSLASTVVLAAASITLVNFDGPGEGLNDPTPVAPVGGNPGTTLGQQRQIALLHAATIWAQNLNSNVNITIRVAFNPLGCTATGATLASAGTRLVARDFPGAPFPATWYHASLANKLVGQDQFGGQDQNNSQFNSNLGQPNCLAGSPFYYGLDNNEGNGIDLVTTALHEFAHTFGFASITNASTGAFFQGFAGNWDHFLLDDTSNKRWIEMTATERQASAVNFRRLSWLGANVTQQVPAVLSLGTARLQVSGVNAGTAAGDYVIGDAAFGPTLSSPGVTADIMPVLPQPNDAGGNGCAPYNAANAAAVKGKIAIVSRGICPFADKVLFAQVAGAVGVIIHNNAAGSPITLGGTPLAPITIPAVMVSLPDGNAIRARLAFRSRTASGVVGNLGVNLGQYAGANAAGRALVFTPNPFVGGSSVSHWDTLMTRNQIMEPSITRDLVSSIRPPEDLTLPLFIDLGW